MKDFLYDKADAYELIRELRAYYAVRQRSPRFWLEEDERGLLSIRSNIVFKVPE